MILVDANLLIYAVNSDSLSLANNNPKRVKQLSVGVKLVDASLFKFMLPVAPPALPVSCSLD